ncbi:MAG: ATP-binding protein [Candidatus Zixiibacteriota bacterium]|nr:MAG: ATP-binding protein [candidate division Zixibacteria bacterium]
MKQPVITGDTISFPSDQTFLQDVDTFVEGTLRNLGADKSVTADIAISVSELVNNAIIHGNGSSPDKSVSVKVTCTNKVVTITVSDEGGGFDPDSVADPLAEENLMKEVGRGIFVIRSLMDKMEYSTTSNGSSVSITKTIS